MKKTILTIFLGVVISMSLTLSATAQDTSSTPSGDTTTTSQPAGGGDTGNNPQEPDGQPSSIGPYDDPGIPR